MTYIPDTYVLYMIAIVNYNFVLAEALCDRHTGHIHSGHGRVRLLQFFIARRLCARAPVASKRVDCQYLLFLQLTDQVTNQTRYVVMLIAYARYTNYNMAQ